MRGLLLHVYPALPNRVLTVAEGNREKVEAVRARLLAALAA